MVPDGLAAALEGESLRFQGQCANTYFTCYLRRVELREGVASYVLLMVQKGGHLNGQVFEEVDGAWRIVGFLNQHGDSIGAPLPKQLLDAEDIMAVPPQWQDILVRARLDYASNGRYPTLCWLNPALGPRVAPIGKVTE